MKNDSFRSEIKNTVLGHDNTIVNILLQQLNSNISSRLIAEEEYINKNEERTKRIVELFEKFLFEYKNALDKIFTSDVDIQSTLDEAAKECTAVLQENA